MSAEESDDDGQQHQVMSAEESEDERQQQIIPVEENNEESALILASDVSSVSVEIEGILSDESEAASGRRHEVRECPVRMQQLLVNSLFFLCSTTPIFFVDCP